jgi:hypothetical protein
MAYAFASKQWTISGSHDFGDFTLLNPKITPINCQVLENAVYLQVEITENNGVFKHYTNVTYTTTTENNVNDLVDDIMAAAFPTATVVA